MQSNPQQYKVYPTLLDAYAWYLQSESEDALKELLDKINRVKTPATEAQAEGTAFNTLVDRYKFPRPLPEGDTITEDGFSFDGDIVREMVERYYHALPQVYCEAPITLPTGAVVTLYGYIDEVIGYKAADIKYTSRYDFPKFINKWQHHIYCYCLNHKNVKVEELEYAVTDGKSVVYESYPYREQDALSKITSGLLDFIEFLEAHRALITDKKIFNEEPKPNGVPVIA